MVEETPAGSASRFREALLDGLACLVLGHLSFLPLWDFITGGHPRLFTLDDSLWQIAARPVLGLTLIVGFTGFLFLRLFRSWGWRWFGAAWALVVLFGAYSLCKEVIYEGLSRFIIIATSPKLRVLIMLVWLAALLGYLAKRGLTRWTQQIRFALLVMAPLVPMVWIQAWQALYAGAPLGVGLPHLERPAKNPVWVLVFDELDKKTLEDLGSLPEEFSEFKRWKGFCVDADQAYPPAGGTLWSVPALLSGRQIIDKPQDMNYINNWQALRNAGEAKRWDWSDSAFGDMAKRGETSAILGWGQFPYWQFYKKSTNLLWTSTEKAGEEPTGIRSSTRKMMGALLLESTLGPFRMARESSAVAKARLLAQVNARIAGTFDRQIPDNTWIHFPVPHWPAVKEGGTFRDNMEAADQSLKSFRVLLQKHHRWEESTIIVIADHWFRDPGPRAPKNYLDFCRGFEGRWTIRDHRVPFLIKFPNQKVGTSIDKPFNLIVLRSLIAALRSGELKEPGQLGQWLIRYSPYGESPSTITLP